MSKLKGFLTGLAAFVAASASRNSSANTQHIAQPDAALDPDLSVYQRLVKYRNRGPVGSGWLLAAHRSHSSHSSHSSHYSGSGGSYVPPADAAPPDPPATPAPVRPAPGQGFYSPASPPDAAAVEVAKLIMKVQLALNARGYCNCAVDGKMTPVLELAIRKFQAANSLKETGKLDSILLKVLEVNF